MSWAEAGERLKKIRLEKGLSLEEVQKKTKIHLNILKAIEGDSLTNLSPVYLKGFMKIYCKFLGQEPKDFIPDYRQTQAPAANISSEEKTRPASIRLRSFGLSKKVQKRIFFMAVIIVLAIVLFNVGKCIAAKRAGAPVTTNMQTKAKTKAQKIRVPVVTPKAVTKETKLAKNNASGIRLGIRARENCWVSLKTDGRLVFQRVLEKGRFKSWQAKEKIELALGNAGVVELEVNGQLFSNLSRKGQALKNISITKEGLNIGR